MVQTPQMHNKLDVPKLEPDNVANQSISSLDNKSKAGNVTNNKIPNVMLFYKYRSLQSN